MYVGLSPDRLIEESLANLKKFSGKDLRVAGDTEEERAESFFSQLIEHGFACVVG
jgi:hypothetical protein